jgi:hypothetical protein
MWYTAVRMSANVCACETAVLMGVARIVRRSSVCMLHVFWVWSGSLPFCVPVLSSENRGKHRRKPHRTLHRLPTLPPKKVEAMFFDRHTSFSGDLAH